MASLMIPEARREEHRAGVMRHKEAGTSKYLGLPQEMTAMRADGTEFPIALSVVPLTGPGVTGFLAVIRDITESKRMQAQFLQSQKMDSVGRLAGGVAHDFNNMLTAILGYADLTLLKLGAGHAVAPLIEEIRKAGERSTSLTRQLLAFARKETIAPKVLNLNESISDILKMLRRVIGENVKLVWVPGSVLWNVKADAAQLDQVLANLAVNARDAMTRTNACLEIATCNVVLDAIFVVTHPGAVQGEFVLLRVTDNGCGMDAYTLENIFEPFFTTKPPGQGTGLGMSTVYGIMKQNNGFIDIQSTLGEGTTFHLYFPRTTEAVEAVDAGKAQALHCEGETILLVDDEESVRVPVGEMLRYIGYQVLVASGGADAVALAEHHTGTIDLLLTDVIMPSMSGVRLRTELLKQRPDLKVLFISGYAGDAISTLGAFDAGTGFLQKPFTLPSLADAVRRSLDVPSPRTGRTDATVGLREPAVSGG
jgi:two-component system, cell cycle sensor histidine kinase and response regulator CckA